MASSSSAARALGFSPDRLERVTSYLTSQVESGRMPFAHISVRRHGREAFEFSHGVANPMTGHAIGADTVARFYSMTKVVTSVAVMQLVERGLVALTDPVKKFIPSFAGMRVLVEDEGAAETDPVRTEPAKRDVSILHLLTHTSGLQYAEA